MTASFSSGNPQDLNALSSSWRAAQPDIKLLLDNDIPVFVGAGNKALETWNGQLRTNTDAPPGLFEGPDYPIIPAGAVNNKRVPWEKSQRGPHVQIWAGGASVQAQGKDRDEAVTWSGTSFAAPIMAGMLATYLAADHVPFSTAPGELVPAAKKYLVDVANWQTNNIKTIWNEVDRSHNPPKAGAASAPVPTPQTSTPSPPKAPYAEGVCGIHVKQTDLNAKGDYLLEVAMTDNSKAPIGYTQPTEANATNPLNFQSKLEDVLVCVPEKEHDYIQFYLGSQQWPSDRKFNPGAVPSCKVGAWDNGFVVE